MKQIKEISIILLSSMCFYSCITPRKIIIADSKKNPTDYFFNISIDSMKKTVEKIFEKQQYCGYRLRNYAHYDSLYIPNLEKNKKDFVLRISTYDYIKCKSKVYYSRYGNPRLYTVKYYFIHLEETGLGVKVYVHAIDPKLRVGWHWGAGMGILNYGIKPRFISVPSTTVEEYEILLMIGNTLGVQNMPPLKIPEKIVVSSIF
jgi:hypothetical protein